MTCTEATNEIPNYCYGEVSSEVEEAVESHVAGCENCRTELARHRKFLELLDERAAVPDAGLLLQCRNDLTRSLRQETSVSHGSVWRGWRNFVDSLHRVSRVQIPFRIPVGAMALVAIGFVGARYTPEKFGGMRAAFMSPMFSSVRSVEPSPSGQVRIAVDETRRHVISGAPDDPQIQELLVNGVTDGSNPNVRLQSIQVLHSVGANSDSDQVRQALIGALEHDPSPKVRLKAIEGLKQFGGESDVHTALANTLQKDDDATVRAQAIDLLSAHRDDSLVGVLQNAIQKEDSPYVREQMRLMLEQFKASVGTY